MTATIARPQAQTIVVPDGRVGIRILPTAMEAWVIDLYAEGYSHRGITAETGMTKSQQTHLLTRLGIPLASDPSAGMRPRFLSGTELLAGERAANARMDAIADARLAASEADLAAWQMRRALTA